MTGSGRAQGCYPFRARGIRAIYPLPRVGPSSPFDPGLRLGEQEWVGPVFGHQVPRQLTDGGKETTGAMAKLMTR
jgi:hypothetical protein